MDELIIKAFSIQAAKLLCPVCSADEPIQPMMAFGDYPDTLFCPHCDLTIMFSAPALDKPNGKHVFWAEHCLKKFIKEHENG